MVKADVEAAQSIREKAYAIWEACGRPDGQAEEHWRQAEGTLRYKKASHDDHADDEERLIDGRTDINYPALLTKDVPGG